jgi:hypothetical protein
LYASSSPSFIFWPLEIAGNAYAVTTPSGPAVDLEIMGGLHSEFAAVFCGGSITARQIFQTPSGRVGLITPQIEDARPIYTLTEKPCLDVPVESESIVNFLMALSQATDSSLLIDGTLAFRFDPNTKNGADEGEALLESIFGDLSSETVPRFPRIRDRLNSFTEAVNDACSREVPAALVEPLENLFPAGLGTVGLFGLWNGERTDLGKLTRVFS